MIVRTNVTRLYSWFRVAVSLGINTKPLFFDLTCILSSDRSYHQSWRSNAKYNKKALLKSGFPAEFQNRIPWFFHDFSRNVSVFPGYKYRINMNRKRLLKHRINSCTDWSQQFKEILEKSMYNNKMYKGMYYVYLKCARSAKKLIHKVLNHWQNSMIFPGWFFQIPWFLDLFHDFSRSGKSFFSFSRFPWFFQRLETLLNKGPPRNTTYEITSHKRGEGEAKKCR